MSVQSGSKISTPSMILSSATAFGAVALTSSRAAKPPPTSLTCRCASRLSRWSRSFLALALCGA